MDEGAAGAGTVAAGSPDATPGSGEAAQAESHDGGQPESHTEGQRADRDHAKPRRLDPNEIDPELISLPRSRARIGPLLALSVVVFSVYIMARIAGDLAFSRQGPEPLEVPSPAALLESEDHDNGFVRVPAVPDRAAAARVTTSRASQGSRLAPVQGTDDRLWLMVDGNVWTAGIRYEEVYTGRLRLIDDLPFAEELRSHVEQRPPAPRFIAPEAARASLAAGASTVALPSGDTVTLVADTPVQVYETAADRVLIEALATERLPDKATWAAALAELGLVAPDAEPADGPMGTWVFTARIAGDVAHAGAPGGEAGSAGDSKTPTSVIAGDIADAIADIEAALLDAKLVTARVLPIESVHEATWGQLADRDGALVVAGTGVPWAHISWLSASVPRHVPAGALVLIADEQPETYWYVLPLFVTLALAALLFLWALVRALLPRERPTAAASP